MLRLTSAPLVRASYASSAPRMSSLIRSTLYSPSQGTTAVTTKRSQQPFSSSTTSFASMIGFPAPPMTSQSKSGAPVTYFQRSTLPHNTIIKFVPQQQAWVVERMGKFNRVLSPGLTVLMPVIDRIAYVQNLKETALEIPQQSAITADNVTLDLDGVLYTRVVDPYKASYGVEDADYAISQLAQTTMRSEIGQLTLDHVLKERANLNSNITSAINEAAQAWGVVCLRYEIRDIHAPQDVVAAMHRQVTAERTKRAEILDSEAQRQSAINVAEGRKQSTILASEALQAETINIAHGEAEAVKVMANATANRINTIAKAMQGDQTNGAVSLSIAEKYVEAFEKLAKQGTTVVVPANLGDIASMVTSGLATFNNISKSSPKELPSLETSKIPSPENVEKKESQAENVA